MSFYLNDFLEVKEISSEEREIMQLNSLSEDLYLQIKLLKNGESKNFFDELIIKIRALINNYVLDEKSTICSPIQKYIFLLYHLYKLLLDSSFLNQKYLLNFLFKRIFLFYDSINPENYNHILIINNSILNLCKGKIEPILTQCINLIVNKYIFETNLKDLEYLLKYFEDNCSYFQISKIKEEIAETLFVQLICLDNFKNSNDTKILNFNDENISKNFIENIITKYYDMNNNFADKNSENNIIKNNSNYENESMKFLFINDFNKSNIHLLRYLRNAIINVFTPIDANILDYFEYYINNLLNKNKYIIENENGLDLAILEKYFLKNNIQDVDIKIRNLSFLIDIIIQKYFNIQNIQEIDLLKFPRINIIVNRLFMEKTTFYQSKKKDLTNAIFEHFIISQFIFNYIKYQIKNPEYYPLEIRYFIIYSYLKISENYLKTNAISAYITCIALKGILAQHLKKILQKNRKEEDQYQDQDQKTRKKKVKKNLILKLIIQKKK